MWSRSTPPPNAIFSDWVWPSERDGVKGRIVVGEGLSRQPAERNHHEDITLRRWLVEVRDTCWVMGCPRHHYPYKPPSQPVLFIVFAKHGIAP